MLTVAGVIASTGTAVVGARNLLNIQAERARSVIPKSWDTPPRADGVYAPGGGPVRRWDRNTPFDLHLMVFGDSTATGYGCRDADEVPGVLIARGLAEESGKLIRLSTKAIVGATSKGLSGQVDAMFVAGPPPDAAVIMIGANDITASGPRPTAWARRSSACAPAAPSWSSAPVRTSASSPQSPSLCAGPPGRADCTWPARRPPRCARPAASRCRSPTC